MSKFFSDLPLEEVVRIIRELGQVGLWPSVSAFTRLKILEGEGREVETLLYQECGEDVLEEYRNFKQSSTLSNVLTLTFKADGQEASKGFFRGKPKSRHGDENVFEAIYLLHLAWVPVFTRMQEKGQYAMMNAYRDWLFLRPIPITQ